MDMPHRAVAVGNGAIPCRVEHDELICSLRI